MSRGSAADYNWTSDATSWVSVNDGVVSFINKGNKNKVTVTGSSKSGNSNNVTYSFTLKSWYINDGVNELAWSDANAYCSSQTGFSVPTVHQITGNNVLSASIVDGNYYRRSIGSLMGEWSSLASYTGSGFYNLARYWTSDVYHAAASNNRNGNNLIVNDTGVDSVTMSKVERHSVICMQVF